MVDPAILDARTWLSQSVTDRVLGVPLPPPLPVPSVVDLLEAKTSTPPSWTPMTSTLPMTVTGGGLYDAAKEGLKTGTMAGPVADFWSPEAAARFVAQWGFPFPVRTIPQALDYAKRMADAQLIAGARAFWGSVWTILASRQNKATTGFGFD